MNDISPGDSAELDERPFEIVGANFWIRAIAHTIDFSILMVITFLISIPLFIRAVQKGLAADPSAMDYPVWVDFAYQLVLGVGVVALWRKTQTTPGKAVFKLRIVDLRDGSRPSLPRLIGRFIGYLVAMVPIPLPLVVMAFPSLKDIPLFGAVFTDWRMMIPLMLGYFWILIDSRNRGWHDLMSGTVTTQMPETPTPLNSRPQA